ncbi:uncharacterized protein TRUGW13939_08398 [Talaromyces rugulosus]|uniref:RSE1/DDB1/CPSF1 C-terminal domain-containing protein n=1 Tax=Talaromyces rugulosus TaxID=121627 RepID=A0A7H8R4G6_TALRU|nr:uncharacterized protein TRUGW13939_08398 [Talaromyces rugulosus]QKX61250.1 hypothetical protein TRUGW13939_08398 [Talaromyces rugulosus]
MFLYSLTLQQPTVITQAIVGQFCGTTEQQIMSASGSCLAILRLDPNLGRVVTVLSHHIFSIILNGVGWDHRRVDRHAIQVPWPGKWASCISIVDPVGEEPRVLQTVDLEGNEAAISATVASFTSQEGESFLVVGTGKDMVTNPRQFSGGYLYVYRFHDGGQNLEIIHKTRVEEPPLAILPFQGQLKQLLRKGQSNVAPQLIVSVQTQGSRIIVGDVQHGVTMVAYKHKINKFIPFVDDTIARWTTSITMVDYDSIAGGDKFGNIWIVRCPDKTSADADEPGSETYLTAREYLNGAPNRLELMAHFFTQDIPTSICKARAWS